MRYRAFIVALVALCLGVLTACADSVTATSNVPLTYDQIKNTGLANNCPQLSETTSWLYSYRSKQFLQNCRYVCAANILFC